MHHLCFLFFLESVSVTFFQVLQARKKCFLKYFILSKEGVQILCKFSCHNHDNTFLANTGNTLHENWDIVDHR